ncbi:MAG: hypothetical protein NVSMB14_11730 [Isosphaeraceae bacterium]
MKLLADESVEGIVVERLRQEGHDVDYIAELTPGISDDEVLKRAVESSALLLTGDRDFGELVFRQKLISNGILLIRLAGLSNAAKAETIVEVLRDHKLELTNAFCVVSRGSLRRRPMI